MCRHSWFVMICISNQTWECDNIHIAYSLFSICSEGWRNSFDSFVSLDWPTEWWIEAPCPALLQPCWCVEWPLTGHLLHPPQPQDWPLLDWPSCTKPYTSPPQTSDRTCSVWRPFQPHTAQSKGFATPPSLGLSSPSLWLLLWTGRAQRSMLPTGSGPRLCEHQSSPSPWLKFGWITHYHRCALISNQNYSKHLSWILDVSWCFFLCKTYTCNTHALSFIDIQKIGVMT